MPYIRCVGQILTGMVPILNKGFMIFLKPSMQMLGQYLS
jgi:hypothetical protein